MSLAVLWKNLLFCRFCTNSEQRLGSLDEIRNHPFFLGVDWDHIRDRPAAYQPRVKSIDDTSNFDDFPDVDLKIRMFLVVLFSAYIKSSFSITSQSK